MGRVGLYKPIPSCSFRVKCLCDAMRSARQNHTLLYVSVKYVAQGSWIIYSGASDHICGSLNWYDSYSQINPINAKLPTGHLTIAKLAANTLNIYFFY